VKDPLQNEAFRTGLEPRSCPPDLARDRARDIGSSIVQSGRPFHFYGAERSYFSGKARAALRAKRVYFEEILPTPQAMREIRRRTGLTFLPTVVTPEDETWQDTSDIIDALETRFPEPALLPATPVQRIVSYLIELYADEFMILPAMHYRWGTPEGVREARDAFAAASGDTERSQKFADAMGGSLPMLGVVPETVPAIVAHLDDLLDLLESVLTAQSFLLGEQMSLADCALLGPLYAHLFLDLVPGPMLRRRAPRVSHWIERTNHPNPDAFTGFRAGDALRESLRAVLGLIGRDAAPVILDTVRDFERWADEQGETFEPPRAVGFHATRLRGVVMQRYTSPYTLWMLQRPLDAYRTLSPAERGPVDAALAGTGCDDLLSYEPRFRLEKRTYKLAARRL
jgi:glutathione S-transferase